MLDLQVTLADPHGKGHNDIRKNNLQQRSGTGNSVHHREGDDGKEIGHLTHRHRISTITHDGEDAKQTDTNTH